MFLARSVSMTLPQQKLANGEAHDYQPSKRRSTLSRCTQARAGARVRLEDRAEAGEGQADHRSPARELPSREVSASERAGDVPGDWRSAPAQAVEVMVVDDRAGVGIHGAPSTHAFPA